MKKLFIILPFIFIFSSNVFADKVTCVNNKTGDTSIVLYDTDEIKAFGKTFEDPSVSGNSIYATYTKWKSASLIGKTIDEYWTFLLSFEISTSSKLTKSKYVGDNLVRLSEQYYNCN